MKLIRTRINHIEKYFSFSSSDITKSHCLYILSNIFGIDIEIFNILEYINDFKED